MWFFHLQITNNQFNQNIINKSFVIKYFFLFNRDFSILKNLVKTLTNLREFIF